MKTFFSFIAWILVGTSAFLFFVVALVIWLLTAWWDKRLWCMHRYSTYWALFYIWCNPLWKIDIEGREHIRKGQTYIIVSNHQSALDILLLYRLITHFKWVAKKELFRVPVIGWNMVLNKYITIDRKSPRDAAKMMKKATKHLGSGSSVLFFAEGTRTLDGKVKKFKEGAFLLAKKTQQPILPVVINGTLEALPKKGFIIKGRQTFQIRILPEHTPESFLQLSPAEMGRKIHDDLLEVHKKLAPEYYR